MSEFARWHALRPYEAERVLLKFCSSENWARDVVRGRPYSSVEDLIGAFRKYWLALSEDEWLTVLSGHDRLAEANTDTLSSESIREQSDIYAGVAQSRKQLAAMSADYEAHFGFMFITSAYGRTIDDLTEELVQRGSNSRSVEFSNAILQHQLIAERRMKAVFEVPITCELDSRLVVNPSGESTTGRLRR